MSELANPLPRDASPEQRLNLRHLRERTYLPDDQAPYHGISHPDKVWSNAEVLMSCTMPSRTSLQTCSDMRAPRA
jgi:hypothetical protein